MRKLLVTLVAAFALICFSAAPMAAQDVKLEKDGIKLRHKAERRALKEKLKFWKQSLKGQPLPKSERVRIKHQMRREKRELRERRKKREIESLERYRQSLQNELTGVDERLAQLSSPESE